MFESQDLIEFGESLGRFHQVKVAEDDSAVILHHLEDRFTILAKVVEFIGNFRSRNLDTELGETRTLACLLNLDDIIVSFAPGRQWRWLCGGRVFDCSDCL